MQRQPSFAVLGFAVAMLAATAFTTAGLAQDTSATSPAPAGEVGQRPGEGSGAKPKPTTPAPAGAVGSKPGDGTGAKPVEGSSPPTSSKPTPQHFEPTEKVRPDFDVAFPIDI
jgi:hypothetical protein